MAGGAKGRKRGLFFCVLGRPHGFRLFSGPSPALWDNPKKSSPSLSLGCQLLHMKAQLLDTQALISPQGARHLGTEKWLARMLIERPHWFWPFSQAQIVCDPNNMAMRHQATARSYFEKNPDVVKAWEMHTSEYQQKKLRSDSAMQFPTVADFLRHVEQHYVNRPR